MATMLLGKKIGMTQVYDDKGGVVPVTVIQAGPCPILQVKTTETDGYTALQLGYGDVKRTRQLQPEIGHAKKANTTPKRFIREVRIDAAGEYKPGDQLTVEIFKDITFVDIVGTSKGKGFAGVMKRHHFKGMPNSHGCERKHRSPGGIGAMGGPRGRARTIKKGKKMAGHMGAVRRTARNLKVVKVDAENNLLLVKGSIPGVNDGFVMVSKAKTKK